MENNNVNVDAKDVIAQYRTRVDELEFSNTVLQLQVKAQQAKIDELTKATKPAEIDPENGDEK